MKEDPLKSMVGGGICTIALTCAKGRQQYDHLSKVRKCDMDQFINLQLYDEYL